MRVGVGINGVLALVHLSYKLNQVGALVAIAVPDVVIFIRAD